jgi:formylglycine-generating enzyme required for sulfatase activity
LIPVEPSIFKNYRNEVDLAIMPVLELDLVERLVNAGSVGDGPGGFSYPKEEVAAVKNAIDLAKSAVDKLNLIEPPAELDAAHEDLEKSFSALVFGLEKVSEHQRIIDLSLYYDGVDSILVYRDLYNAWESELVNYSQDYVPKSDLPGLDIGSTMRRDEDGMTMLYIPSGHFEMGAGYRHSDEIPVHIVYLDSYWIDETEVTNAMFTSFVNATGYQTDIEKDGYATVMQHPDIIWNKKGVNWMHPLGPESDIRDLGNYPVVYMSWNDSNAYCEWVGARLPTEAEWEKAALWDDINRERRVFPWGNSFSCSNGNYDEEVDGCDSFEQTAPAGSFVNGASSYGALNMASNIEEWVSDWYIRHYNFPGYYDQPPAFNPQGPSMGERRILRGDSWYSSTVWLELSGPEGRSKAIRSSGNPTETNNLVGFRCAQSVP